MITRLDTKHGFEVWVNQKLVEEIESAFRENLKTDTLNYYYIYHNKNSEGKVKWLGGIGLISFIKKIQKVNNYFCVLGVTNAPTKKDLVFYLDSNLVDNKKEGVYDYWIGDSWYQDMDYRDYLFVELWNRVKRKSTKSCKTRKKHFFE